ncbi:hypothetical protein JZ751_008978, partial [Albula glossodonta]
MHCSSPKMVCETKIVADEHDTIPGTKKDSIIVSSSQMWTSSSASPNTIEGKDVRKDTVFIREFERSDHVEVRRIFYEGIMERIPNTAFRGLKHQTQTQFLYAFLTLMCFVVTKSLALTCCAPLILMGARYYFSRKVILSYLDCALHTDMADIEEYYMKPTAPLVLQILTLNQQIPSSPSTSSVEEKDGPQLRRCPHPFLVARRGEEIPDARLESRPRTATPPLPSPSGVPALPTQDGAVTVPVAPRAPSLLSALPCLPLGHTTSLTLLSHPGSCFWVAVLDGRVVGIVAAQGKEEDNTVELRRMSVDSRFRGKGIAKALGRRVLEFAVVNNYSAVVLGTTAVKLAAHKLYESLGFRRVGGSDEYTLPGMSHSLLERMFFQIRYHRYRLQLRE